MIYDSLRKLPKIVQCEILDTGDLSLLSDENTPLEELAVIWENLCDEFNTRYNGKNHKKTFDVYKELNFLANKYDVINSTVEALRFDKDERLINLLLENGYRLKEESYLEDLERVERESDGILVKIKNLQKLLPKKPDESELKSQAASTIENMAAQSAILGYDFDFYTISVEKYHSIIPIVENKIKAIEKTNNSKTKK